MQLDNVVLDEVNLEVKIEKKKNIYYMIYFYFVNDLIIIYNDIIQYFFSK